MNKYDQKMQELEGTFFGVSRGEQPITLAEADLREAERELGHPLPTDYREFLRNYGGYDVMPDLRFPLRNATDGEIEGFAHRFLAVLPRPPYGITYGSDLLLNYENMCHSEWQLSSFPGLTMLRPVSKRSKFIEKSMNFNGTEINYFVDPENGWFEDGMGQLYLPWPRELLPIGHSGSTDICLAIDGDYQGAVFYLQNIPNAVQNFYLVANSFDEFMQSTSKGV